MMRFILKFFPKKVGKRHEFFEEVKSWGHKKITVTPHLGNRTEIIIEGTDLPPGFECSLELVADEPGKRKIVYSEEIRIDQTIMASKIISMGVIAAKEGVLAEMKAVYYRTQLPGVIVEAVSENGIPFGKSALYGYYLFLEKLKKDEEERNKFYGKRI